MTVLGLGTKSRRNTGSVCLAVALCALLLAGCSKTIELAATEVLNEANCKGAADGLAEVDYGAVAAMRGSTLLGISVAPTATASDLLLLSLSKGRQPTAGYRFELRDARLEGETATLFVDWETPAADASMAQILTYPCLVIGLEPGPYDLIRAVDGTGETLGELHR